MSLPTAVKPRVVQPGVRRLSIISGLVGFLLFILTPFMPVTQTQSSFEWPQGEIGSVSAPLLSYTPEKFEARIPAAAFGDLRPGASTVLSTLPTDSKEATTRGLFVRLTPAGLDVIVRNRVPLEISSEQLAQLPKDAAVTISSTAEATTVGVAGATKTSGAPWGDTIDEDVRPQLTGVYTDLLPSATPQLVADGLSAHVEINSRFTTSPSLLKCITMVGGLIALLISLVCLYRIDAADGRGTRRFFPRGWFRPTPLDGIVVAVLSYWYVMGANTSDDGYLLTMARESHPGTYMANYYRWFGVPESPFGAPYYDLLGVMAQVSTSSMWMRLPEFLAGIVTWWLVTKEVLPRLGAKISGRRVAHWTAASAFLAFWMVYNNGLRPEPIIALGALLTWLSIERAIATSRLLPFAVGIIIATISLGAGPTGLMAVAALLAGVSGLIRIFYRRLPLLGGGPGASKKATVGAVFALGSPLLASGTAILLAVFGDQTLMTVLESIRVRSAIGPSLHWYEEWVRYYTLMLQNPDGSFTRRFPVLMMFVYLALVLASVLKHGRVPGSAQGPAQRLMLVFFGTMFFMMFTPTKWTHHFGVYAGIGAALAGLAAVAASQFAMRSARNRTLFIGLILFVLSFSLSGTNGWWYISSYGIPWYDKTIQYRHVEASSILLIVSLLVLLIAAIQSFLSDMRKASAETTHRKVANPDSPGRLARYQGLAAAPICIATSLMVVFSMLSLAKGFVHQYPAYSVGMGNLRTLMGQPCSLANDVLVETNTNESFLTPVDPSVSLGDSLEAGDVRGFEANKVPPSINIDGPPLDTVQNQPAGGVTGATSDAVTKPDAAGQASGNQGGIRHEVGINGSRARLPFGIDYTKVPVVGSFTEGPQFPAEDTTVWFKLPPRQPDAPLLVISAAGKIEHHDYNGVHQDGQKLLLEYGHRDSDGAVTQVGTIEPYDVGASPSWRNLRVPLDKLPADANVVRIVASDLSLAPKQWLAFTPPRIPKLEPMNSFLPTDSTGLIDWSVALQFPCQKPFTHFAGVTQVPTFRISPDHAAKVTHSQWQGYEGGGIMSIAQAVNTSTEMPTYLNHDWARDWGSLETYQQRTNIAGQEPKPAAITYDHITRMGWWSPGHMWLPER